MVFGELNAYCKLMMLMLLHKQDYFKDRLVDGYFWYDDDRFSKEMSVSTKTVKRCRAILKSHGFIDVIVGAFRKNCTRYKVLRGFGKGNPQSTLIKKKVDRESNKVDSQSMVIQQEGGLTDPINKDIVHNKDSNKEIVAPSVSAGAPTSAPIKEVNFRNVGSKLVTPPEEVLKELQQSALTAIYHNISSHESCGFVTVWDDGRYAVQ